MLTGGLQCGVVPDSQLQVIASRFAAITAAGQRTTTELAAVSAAVSAQASQSRAAVASATTTCYP